MSDFSLKYASSVQNMQLPLKISNISSKCVTFLSNARFLRLQKPDFLQIGDRFVERAAAETDDAFLADEAELPGRQKIIAVPGDAVVCKFEAFFELVFENFL